MAMILRKLDQLDVSRVRVIPFCGKGGRFKYEILVKTGWSRGSGKERDDWVGTWSLPWSRPSGLDPGPCQGDYGDGDHKASAQYSKCK